MGITPAHAGKSWETISEVGKGKDHPRTRGEKSPMRFMRSFLMGSPPHTRGKVPIPLDLSPYGGITPAHAGKSGRFFVCGNHFWDHPRTRGEKKPTAKVTGFMPGSPPHTRGKEAWGSVGAIGERITPAHAGKRLNKPPYYGHSSAAGHRISFNFPMSSYVSRQSVKALCAPRISIPKYSQSAVSVY